MRFRLTMDVDKGSGNVLPVNYQYELSSWIYRVLNSGNRTFTGWLHERGFNVSGKAFRLFTFSGITVPKYRIDEDRLAILEGPLSMIISFVPVSSMKYFIRGLFKDQQMKLGDRKSSVLLNVHSVEQLPVQEFDESHRFRCLSPIVISHRQREKDKYARYLGPEDEGYGSFVAGNLMEKYHAYDNGMSREDRITDDLVFKSESKARSKLIAIKQGTPQETKIRGFLYDFTVMGPPELIRLGYYAGFGEKNSLGFGCVDVME